MLRSIGAVIGGFILWSVLWLGANSLLTIITPGSYNEDGSTDSGVLMLLILVLSVLFSVISGYTAEKIVDDGSTWPVWALALALLLVGLLVQISFWSLFPLWYNILFLLFLVPATLAGSRLAQ